MKLTKLLERLDYKVVAGSDNIEITELVNDSRKVVPGSVFVCISGAVSDGHQYVKDVAERGAAAVIVEKDVEVPEGLTVIKVENTRYALALMSAAYFGYPAEKLKTIGITGTKGKTTTTYMVKAILEEVGHKVGLIGTIEAIIGDKTIPSNNTTPESYTIQKYFAQMVEAGCVQEGMERFKGFIGEEFDTKVSIVENGVKYMVDVKDGQKTGFFLDQKYNRAAIRPMCKDAKVLDCFTHTGSFALNAGMAGAKSVLGVDASELGVAQATENAALNGLSDRVSFICEDVFELLPRLEKEGELFDVVILDPPAFTKSRNSIKNAVKGYREINLRAMKLVKNGGYLATCSCSHFMNPELFSKTIGEAAANVHKRLRQIEYKTQSPDHPILWSRDEESLYLKFYIFQVCDEL